MNEVLLLKPPEPKKGRSKIHVKVSSRFDRAGGAVDGVMTIDKETGIVHVREKGSKKSYSMRLADVVQHICVRGLFGERDE